MSTVDLDKAVWVEAFRPHNIEECILPKRIKDYLSKFVDNENICNYTAAGSAGSGKTSSARAMLEEMGLDYLVINASSNGNIDTVRTTIIDYASKMSLTGDYRVIILDECLEENEKVRIGTVDSWKPVSLNELNPHGIYPVVSFNMETGEFENDHGYIISDKEDVVYDVKLENGTSIKLNSKHPFIVKDESGKFIEKTIDGGLSVKDVIVTVDGDVKVKSIKKIGKARVINLTVLKNHTFVTENGIVTHNCDYMTPNAQAALRGIIEQFNENCRFILTANYPNRIIDALKSRCPLIDFNFTKEEKMEMIKEFFKRSQEILDSIGVTYDRKELLTFINKNFPDFRKMLNLMQRSAQNGTLELSGVGSASDDKIAEIIKYLKDSEFTKMRKWVAESMDSDSVIIRRALYDKVYDYADPGSIPSLVMILNEYDYKEGFVTDREINFVAMLTEIMKEVEFK